jgi:hypothetical protein
MEENSETIIIKYNTNVQHYKLELKYNFCSCMFLISSKIFNASYLVSINYDDEECDIKCLTKVMCKDMIKDDIDLSYDIFDNSLYLNCEYTCPQDTVFTIKIIY